MTQFQNVMPWVMIAPLGWPVVPEVYMMVEMSSSVTISALVERLCRRDRRLVGAAGAEQQRGRTLQSFATVSATSASSVSWIITFGDGVADDELQLGNGEAGVERQEHRADPEAGELHLQRIGCVQRQHRDPVAARDLEFVAQMRGEQRDARVELRIGEAGARWRGRSAAILSGVRRPKWAIQS